MASPPVAHFVQVGAAPVCLGDGSGTLDCPCGRSLLVAGYRPGSLLAISIQCFACGAVTTTPSLPPGEVLPARVRAVAPDAEPVPTSLRLPPGTVLAGTAELQRADRLNRPHDPPREPMSLSAATIAEAVTDYDRLTQGGFAAHLQASQGPTPGRHSLAWALGRLQGRVGQPGWSCLADNPDSVSAAHLGAFRHFVATWSQHPLFAAMAATVATDGFSVHALAVFAAAKNLFDGGNHVVFDRPAADNRIGGFSLGPPGAEDLSAVVQPVTRFEWPRLQPADPATLRVAILEAAATAQGRLNAKRPGILVLSLGGVPADFDQPLVDGIGAVLRAQGRRHRGITAVAAILPKLVATPRRDQVAFGWAFYPIANPHHATGRTVKIGAREDFAGLATPAG